MNRLEGKVAIVTGSSSGNGRAIAIASAKEGAKVVCSDIRSHASTDGYESNKEKDTDQLIRDTGGKAIFVPCDVSKADEVETLVKAAVEKYGCLDIIYNNAGIFAGPLGTIVERSEKDVDITMAVNFKGVWNGCRQAIKQYLKQGRGGKIVNISSIAALVGLAGEPDYCASKGAIISLTKELAVDFGPHGICVNAICPGFIETAMTRSMPQEARNNIISATPLRRAGTAEDVANAAVFLASSDAEFITGNILVVDGGKISQT